MSFLDQRLPTTVSDLLRERGLDGSALTLEVIESDLLDEQRGAAVFRELENLGVRLSIDDFGTGYSSFSRLRALDVAEVKIDRAFVSGLGESAEDAIIVRATVQLAQLLGHDVVAEGVESKQQLDWLQRMGCGSAQGFLWSPAVHRDEMFALIIAGTRYDVGLDTAEALDGELLDIEVRGTLLDQIDEPKIATSLRTVIERLEDHLAGDAIVIRDLAGRLLVANDRYRALAASSAQVGSLNADGHDDALIAAIDAVPSPSRRASIEMLDSSEPLRTTVVPLRDRSGRTVGSVHVVRSGDAEMALGSARAAAESH